MIEAELARVVSGDEAGLAAQVTGGDQKVDDRLAQTQAPGNDPAADWRKAC